jgi:hypothetical protein
MTVVVRGYREFLRATQGAGKDVKREVREAFREVGVVVRADADRRFSDYGPAASRASHTRSADQYRVAVRQRGVDVEQRLRKTTGKHGEYGSAQMRHGLVPALEANRLLLRARMEHAMDEVVDIFEKRTL